MADYRMTAGEAHELAQLAIVRPDSHDMLDWATIRDCVKRDWTLTMLAWDLIDMNPEPEALWIRLYDMADLTEFQFATDSESGTVRFADWSIACEWLESIVTDEAIEDGGHGWIENPVTGERFTVGI